MNVNVSYLPICGMGMVNRGLHIIASCCRTWQDPGSFVEEYTSKLTEEQKDSSCVGCPGDSSRFMELQFSLHMCFMDLHGISLNFLAHFGEGSRFRRS